MALARGEEDEDYWPLSALIVDCITASGAKWWSTHWRHTFTTLLTLHVFFPMYCRHTACWRAMAWQRHITLSWLHDGSFRKLFAELCKREGKLHHVWLVRASFFRATKFESKHVELAIGFQGSLSWKLIFSIPYSECRVPFLQYAFSLAFCSVPANFQQLPLVYQAVGKRPSRPIKSII